MQIHHLDKNDFYGLTNQEAEFKKQAYDFHNRDLMKQESFLREQHGVGSKLYLEGMSREQSAYDKKISKFSDNEYIRSHYEKFITGSNHSFKQTKQVDMTYEAILKSVEKNYNDSIRVNDLYQIKNYYDQTPMPEMKSIGVTTKQIRNHYKSLNEEFLAETTTFRHAYNFMQDSQKRELSLVVEGGNPTEHYRIEKKHDFESKLFNHLENDNPTKPSDESAKQVVNAYVEYQRTLGVRINLIEYQSHVADNTQAIGVGNNIVLKSFDNNDRNLINKKELKPISKSLASNEGGDNEEIPIMRNEKPIISQKRLKLQKLI